MDDPCIFCTQRNSIIDFVHPSETATTALRRLASEYGTHLQVLPFNEACARSDAARVTDPAEIDEAAFLEALNVLPPRGWVNTGDAESFRISEAVSGNVFSIYARLGARYFTFDDLVTLRHADICEKISSSRAYGEQAQTR